MGWMCPKCKIAVLSGPAACPQCGRPGPTIRLRVQKKVDQGLVSELNRAKVEELDQHYPQHNWVGEKNELIRCARCGSSGATPQWPCELPARRAT